MHLDGMDGCEYGNETWLMYEDGGGLLESS